MSVSIKTFPSIVEVVNAALVRRWKEARFKCEAARAELKEAERKLAGRAREMRLDFDAPFAPDGQTSRSVVIDGGDAGRVNVTCEAVFKVAKDLGEKAKNNLEGRALRFRKRMAAQLGEEVVEDLELITRVTDAITGRAALSSSAVKKVAQAFSLYQSHPRAGSRRNKALRDAVQAAVDSLRPLENKVSVSRCIEDLPSRPKGRDEDSRPKVGTRRSASGKALNRMLGDNDR